MGRVAVRGLRLAVGGSLIRGRVGRLLLLVARLRVVRRWPRGVRAPWRRSIAAILGWRGGSCRWRISRTLLILGVVRGVDRTEHQLCTLPRSSAWFSSYRGSHRRTQSSRVKWTGGFARDISSCSTSKSENHHQLIIRPCPGLGETYWKCSQSGGRYEDLHPNPPGTRGLAGPSPPA